MLYQKLSLTPFNESKGIQSGDLITLENHLGVEQYLFLGPDAAGLKIQHGEQVITVITSRAPLGQTLLGKQAGDELEISVNGSRQTFEVTQIL
jgi:transcription elongation GreA/GreB family factor